MTKMTLLRNLAAACLAIVTMIPGAALAAAQTPPSAAEAAYLKKDYTTALDLARQACQNGNADGCHLAGAMLYKGQGVSADVTGARAMLERGCNQRSGKSCFDLASTWMLANQADYAEARPWLEKACALGNGAGCAYLGKLQYGGLGGAADRTAALTTLQRACDLDNRDGCASLGGVQGDEKAPGGANWPAAAKAFMKGCDLGDTSSCKPAAALLLTGERGVPPDPAAGLRALSRTCASGADEVCKGWSLRRRFPQYKAAFATACRSPNPVGCLDAALVAAVVAETPEAFASAAELADRACKPSGPGPKACRARDLMQAIGQELRGCQTGSQSACGRMSARIMRLVDEFEDLDTQRAMTLPVRYAQAACNAGELEGCAAVAWVWYFTDSEAAIDTAAEVAARACAGKVALGCEFIGAYALNDLDEQLAGNPTTGHRLPRAVAAWQFARPVLAEGCRAEWAEGCIALILRQRIMEPDRAFADDAMRAACGMTWASRCFQIASTLLGADFRNGIVAATLRVRTTQDGSGCVFDEAVCRGVGNWNALQNGSSPNRAFGKGQETRWGLALMDEACTRGSADACVFMGAYHTPSDNAALAERQPDWASAARYARKILALDPGNVQGERLAKGAAERGL